MPDESSGAREGELTTSEAAELCAYAAQPLEVLAAAGAIPGARFHGGRWYLPRVALREFGADDGGMAWANLGRADVRP